MAIKTVFSNGVEYDAEDVNRRFSYLFSNGVISDDGTLGTRMKVAQKTGNTVTISPGVYQIQGATIEVLDGGHDFDLENGSVFPRMDIVAVEHNVSGGTGNVRFVQIQGTSPSRPALTQTATVWQEALAEVYFPVSGTLSMVTDARDKIAGLVVQGELATASKNGLMSSADKTKLNGIASGAEANVQADWNQTSTSSDAYIKNKPASLPANGGNADTVDNKHADAFALVGHTHNYLPLAGGNMTGAPVLPNGTPYKCKLANGNSYGVIGLSTSNNIWIGQESAEHGNTYITASTNTGLKAAVGSQNYTIYHAGNEHKHTMLENANAQQLYMTVSGNILPTKNGDVDANYNPKLGNSQSRFGQIYSTNATISTSDAREKKDIADIEHAQELIMALQPRQFKYVENQSNRTHYGLIAQEVKEAMTAAGIDDCAAYIRGPLDEEADPNTALEEEVRYGLRYEELIAPLIATVQAQQAAMDVMRNEIQELKTELGINELIE